MEKNSGGPLKTPLDRIGLMGHDMKTRYVISKIGIVFDSQLANIDFDP